jgi:P pilus assembly chaperone PapD
MIFQSLQKLGLSLLSIGTLTLVPYLSASAISIGVSPPRFDELKIDDKRPTTEVFKVVNIGKETATFKVYVQGWTLNEKNEIQSLPPSEQSLDKWILVNPGIFTLPPGKSQTVRFSIRPRVKPQGGEHRALIYVQEIPSADSNSQKAATPVKVIGRYGVGVYAYVGAIKKVGVINSIAVDTKNNPLKATFDISSQGTAYVRMNGQYAIWQAGKFPGTNKTEQMPDLEKFKSDKAKSKLPDGIVAVGNLPTSPVLPDTRRQLILNLSQQLAPGNYVLDVNGELSGTKIDKAITFTVPAKANNPIIQPNNKPKQSK